jgi:hypothetical protein
MHLLSKSANRLTLTQIYIFALYTFSIGFVFSAAVVNNGLGLTTDGSCKASVMLCLMFYAASKVSMSVDGPCKSYGYYSGLCSHVRLAGISSSSSARTYYGLLMHPDIKTYYGYSAPSPSLCVWAPFVSPALSHPSTYFQRWMDAVV